MNLGRFMEADCNDRNRANCACDSTRLAVSTNRLPLNCDNLGRNVPPQVGKFSFPACQLRARFLPGREVMIDEGGEFGGLASEVLVVVAQSLQVLPCWARFAMPPLLKFVQLVQDSGVVLVKGITGNAGEFTQGLGGKRRGRTTRLLMMVQFHQRFLKPLARGPLG